MIEELLKTTSFLTRLTHLAPGWIDFVLMLYDTKSNDNLKNGNNKIYKNTMYTVFKLKIWLTSSELENMK